MTLFPLIFLLSQNICPQKIHSKSSHHLVIWIHQEQLFLGDLIKRCSQNMQEIYRRTPIPKFLCNFLNITLRHGCSGVNLLHIFRTPFQKNGSSDTLIWRSNQVIWKYAKSSIVCKFAGFHLQPYYRGALSQVFHKDKGYTLHNFFRICRATTFRDYFISGFHFWSPSMSKLSQKYDYPLLVVLALNRRFKYETSIHRMDNHFKNATSDSAR